MATPHDNPARRAGVSAVAMVWPKRRAVREYRAEETSAEASMMMVC